MSSGSKLGISHEALRIRRSGYTWHDLRIGLPSRRNPPV